MNFEQVYETLKQYVFADAGDMPVSVLVICNEKPHLGNPIQQTIGSVIRWNSNLFGNKDKILLQTSVMKEPLTTINRLCSAIENEMKHVEKKEIGVQISKIANANENEHIYDISEIYVPKGNLWAQIEIVIKTDVMTELKNDIENV